ncbi:hypothetical protein ACRALDRAFT_2044810 [Sodiomyces alcalophilus JCM 7366]|uniref:uncharacterized protein n=1 Tax=Sodiomyces alcalophilus JCM 7366 TaxID=591952 RepID=UPI0039B69FF8
MSLSDWTLRTSWEVKAEAGEPLASIQIRELQTYIRAGVDAWGRRGKEQPILVSADLSLADRFHTAASTDRVGDDTIHYGLLAKAILASLVSLETHLGASNITLRQALEYLIDDVTYPVSSSTTTVRQRILVDPDKLRFASITLTLPKASLLGDGVSLSKFFSFPPTSTAATWGVCLSIHRLRVPTLIGVNDNERERKQVVIADIDVDMLDSDADMYTNLEAIVVKTMEASSFETLEALAMAIATQLGNQLRCEPPGRRGWHLKVGLEKPTAVPMSQAARVVYRTSSRNV